MTLYESQHFTEESEYDLKLYEFNTFYGAENNQQEEEFKREHAQRIATLKSMTPAQSPPTAPPAAIPKKVQLSPKASIAVK